MKILPLIMFLSSFFLLYSAAVTAAPPIPTCEPGLEADFSQSISVSDGYGPINALAGSVLEEIGDRVDYQQQGYLHARAFDISSYSREQLETTMSSQDYADMIYAYRGEEELMSAGIEEMLWEELEAETYRKQAVFSEFIEFHDAEKNSKIPVATYKFWGYIVPPEGASGLYNLRVTFDDGMVLHMDYGNGMQVIAENFGFNYNETQLAQHDGDIDFYLSAETPYPIHLQWFNKDGPQVLKLEFSAAQQELWSPIPKSWFYPSMGARGIESIALDAASDNVSLDLGAFVSGDSKAQVLTYLTNSTQDGTATIVVRNFFGDEARCSVELTSDYSPAPSPSPNVAPQAVAKVNSVRSPLLEPQTAIEIRQYQHALFIGSESIDDDNIVSYQWQFEEVSAAVNGELVEHRFDTLGEYAVTLTVIDEQGLTDQALVNVTVLKPKTVDTVEPVCEYQFDDYLVSGTVSDSSDINEDFDANRVFSGGESDSNENEMLDIDSGIKSIVLKNAENLLLQTDFKPGAINGRFIVRQIDGAKPGLGELVVTDGYNNQCMQAVAVAANMAPNAIATVSATQAGASDSQIQIDRGGRLYFDSSLSSDGDGEIISRRWDLFSDGSIDSDKVQMDHLFSEPGDYEVLLTVVDNRGLTGSQTIQIVVNDSNTPPVVTRVVLESVTQPGGVKIPGAGLEYFPAGSSLHVTGNAQDREDVTSFYIWQLRDASNHVHLEYKIDTTEIITDEGVVYSCEVTDSSGEVTEELVTSYSAVDIEVAKEGYFDVVLLAEDERGTTSIKDEQSSIGKRHSTNTYVENAGSAGNGLWVLLCWYIWKRRNRITYRQIMNNQY